MVLHMDDILVSSKYAKSHLKHLEINLSRLRGDNSYASPKKYEFMKDEALRDWPKPCVIS